MQRENYNGLICCPIFIHHFIRIFFTQENAERANGERLLGNDPETGEPVFVKLGKYGPIAQIGDTADETKKPKFASLKADQHIKTISLDEALKLFNYPKSLGKHENLEVIVKVGRFGPYIQFGTENVLFQGDRSGGSPINRRS